jgi:hypothetical protein
MSARPVHHRRRTVAAALLLFVFSAVPVHRAGAQSDGGYFLFGAQFAGLNGAGEAGNEFDPGPGAVLQLGVEFGQWAWLMWGVGFSTSSNRVGNSSIGATLFEPYYTDIRRLYGTGRTRGFLSFGMAWQLIHIAGTEGSDNMFQMSLGGGAQVDVSERVFLEVAARPYLLFGNSLEQSTGYELVIGIGRRSAR